MSNPLNQAAEVSQNGGDGGAELQSCSPLEVQHIDCARAPYCPRVAVGLVPAWKRLSCPREHMALALHTCRLAANMIVIQALIHGDACTGGVIDVHDMQ